MFFHGSGNWTDYRYHFCLEREDEVDLHFGRRNRSLHYDDAMAEITDIVRQSLREAQRKRRPYIMFIHGSSTSGLFKTTARSQVRGFMRSKEATPLIERSECVQHDTVFVAKVRLPPP
jgi:hypothetical protein